MSSRALTSDQIRQMYAYNLAEERSTVQIVTSRVKDKEAWGSPRHRLLVHAVTTLAFNCLLRLDEVLNLRFEDMQLRNGTVVITLSSRKTHQFGGLCSIRGHPIHFHKFCVGSKPYFLWLSPKEDEPLCPVLALARWIQTSCLQNCTGYVFRAPGSAGQAPPLHDQPVVRFRYRYLR